MTGTFDLHGFRLVVDTVHGLCSLTCGDRYANAISSSVRYSKGSQEMCLSLLRNAAIQTASQVGGQKVFLEFHVRDEYIDGVLVFSAQECDPFVQIGCELRLREGDDDIRILSIDLFDAPVDHTYVGAQRDVARFRGQTMDVWSSPGTKPLARTDSEDDLPCEMAHLAGGIYNHGGDAITLFFLLPALWIDTVCHKQGRLRAGSRVEVPLRTGETFRSDRLFVNLSNTMPQALESFSLRHKPRHRIEEGSEHWGWNSWDYYNLEISHEKVMENVRSISRLPWLRQRMKYIIIDDGWERMVGEWEPDQAKFPSGMPAIASEIKEAGFVPGIWSAPFFVDIHCELMQKHPEYAVQYKGEPFSPFRLTGCEPPWGDRFYLDPTHPAVQEHIYQLYRKLHRWGFRYFKTDFLVDPIRTMLLEPELIKREGAPDKFDPGSFSFHDPDIGLLRAHRTCMNAIRAAIGEESFWLGCGSCIATGAEIMDASRISADIGVFFPNLLCCSRGAIFNSYLHGAIWLNDPDFAVFRGPETFDASMFDAAMRNNKPYERKKSGSGPPFSLMEAQLWATMLILSGGLLTLSDRIAGLNEKGLDTVKTLLRYAGGPPAIPLDHEQSFPSILRQDNGTRRLLGLINWGEQPRRFSLSTPSLKPLVDAGEVLDVWTGQKISVRQMEDICVEPHSGKLLHWTVE